MTTTLLIGTRYAANTYHARAAGKTATATNGHQAAAEALARKIWPGQRITLERLESHPGQQREVWGAAPIDGDDSTPTAMQR